MERVIEIEGQRWRVLSLAQHARRAERDPWHYARVRFEPPAGGKQPPRETWLRVEEDLPSEDVLDQYADEQLAEAFLVAEEVERGA